MQGFPLAVCGSGLALGLPDLIGTDTRSANWQGIPGRAVALAGSCSRATREQIAVHREHAPVRTIDIDAVIAGTLQAYELADWAMEQAGVPLIYSSDDPETVRAVQARYGRDRSAETIETFFGQMAVALVERGVGSIISAGGETSGAIVSALETSSLEIGPMIDPGVPAVATCVGGTRIGLALKSGNFGAPDFFAKAARILGETA